MGNLNIKKSLEALKHYIDTYDQQPNYQEYSFNIFVHDILYGLGIAIDKDKYHAAQGYKKFKFILNQLIATDEWISIDIAPSDELLNEDG